MWHIFLVGKNLGWSAGRYQGTSFLDLDGNNLSSSPNNHGERGRDKYRRETGLSQGERKIGSISTAAEKKPHAVCVPYPVVVNASSSTPLHSTPGVSTYPLSTTSTITVASAGSSLSAPSTTSTTFNPRQFRMGPRCLIAIALRTCSLCESTMNSCLALFRELLVALKRPTRRLLALASVSGMRPL